MSAGPRLASEMKTSLIGLSFLTGATVMAKEMAASRLVAPYLGPFLLRVGLGGVERAGAHAGSLSASSTLGSITGTLARAPVELLTDGILLRTLLRSGGAL